MWMLLQAYNCRQTSKLRSKYDGERSWAVAVIVSPGFCSSLFCHSWRSWSVWASHFLKTPSSFRSTSSLDISNFHFGLLGHVKTAVWRSASMWKDLKVAFSIGMGRNSDRVDASNFVSSKYFGGSLMNVDWSFLADSTSAALSELLIWPIFDLRWWGFFFGSGWGTSPRFIARLSCWSAFFCRVDVGLRRAGMMVVPVLSHGIYLNGISAKRCMFDI